ncbi:MAG: nucleotidyltransferase family protein [Anaerolineales bacterium]|nr:nucleotidyltransferase family protein [Anaerolineales bacterium]
MFPTASQELLLRSALLSGETAISAWREWKGQTDLDADVDIGSHRLLPLVYKNLAALGVEDTWMGKLKGIYRLTWYKNQSLFQTASKLIKTFQDAQIQTLILKGAPLILSYYQDFGVRPMGDLDILVPTEKGDEAFDLLLQLGWKPMQIDLKHLDKERKVLRHAWGFVNPAGQSIDLHWHVFALLLEQDADLAFWESSVPIAFLDVKTRALCATDLLLHVCVHGGQWDSSSSIRWITDAFYILAKAQSEINWDRLLEQAEKNRFVVPLRLGLFYLRDRFDAPIPDEVLHELSQVRTSAIEEKLFRTLGSKPTFLGNLPVYWYKYLCRIEKERRQNLDPRRLVGFIDYLQEVKGVESKIHLIKWAATRTCLRIGRALRGIDQALP